VVQDRHVTASTPQVLVVDDDQDLLASLERGLRLEGLDVRTACDGAQALEAVTHAPPNAMVLDVTMPGVDGVEVVRRLRGTGDEVPVLLLSARAGIDDRVLGLEAGADDYLVKPFAFDELVARLRALLRRGGDRASVPVTVGPLRIDPARRTVTLDGERVDLSKREFEVLQTLAVNAGIVLSRQRLLELVWGYDFDTETNVVDVFVGYLRRKLESGDRPRLLHTVRGVGFVLRAG
jgi:two-component system response regulator PrrA